MTLHHSGHCHCIGVHCVLATCVSVMITGSSPSHTHTHTDKSVFGVPLLINVRREGKALPSSILAGFDHLRKNGGLETRGLFRRAASKAKIEGLKLITESNPDNTDYDDFSCYEVADFVKLYFRELPEPLLTSRLSETLIMIQESECFNVY